MSGASRDQKWRNSGRRKKELLLFLLERDGGKCRYCAIECTRANGGGTNLDTDATIEHWPLPRAVLPVERWLDPECCILACYRCNQNQDHGERRQPIDCPLPEAARAPSALALALQQAMEARYGDC